MPDSQLQSFIICSKGDKYRAVSHDGCIDYFEIIKASTNLVKVRFFDGSQYENAMARVSS